MGDLNPMDIVSDLGSVMTYGVINIKKGRINVPFSGAMVGDYLKGMSNLATGEQMRGDVNDFFTTPLAKSLETVAGVVAGVVVTAGVGSVLMAPAVGVEAATAGGIAAEAGGIATSAAAPTAAGTLAAVPAAEGAGAAALTAGAPVTASGAIPLASGVAPTGAELAGATLTGPVGAPAITGATAPSIATPTGTGMIASSVAPEAAGYTNAVSTAEAIKAAQAAPTIAGLSDPVKMALVLAAGQMATGTAGGLFTGMSQQKQLELQQLINEQNQTQRQYFNKNNSYAPSLKFKKPTGMIAQPKTTAGGM